MREIRQSGSVRGGYGGIRIPTATPDRSLCGERMASPSAENLYPRTDTPEKDNTASPGIG
jgi:hypothetical protein